MEWQPTEFGGWRSGPFYVGQTPKKWWRLWRDGVLQPDVFAKADDAKYHADNM